MTTAHPPPPTLERRSSITSIEHRSGRLYEVEASEWTSGNTISIYALTSVVILFFLFVITEPKHAFVFTAGENLRIPIRYSILTQDHYEITIPQGKEGAVDAFSLETCPTFSGQIINLNYEQDLLLNGQDYQYDYFILHPGSIIYAKVTATKGSAYFYLLQGDVFQLESLRHGKSFDVNSFRAVNMVYVSDSQTTDDGSGGVVVTHTVKNEFAGRGQVWVLYYENPTSSGATLHTRYAMKATSYNLNSFRPTCSTSSSSRNTHCVVEANPCTIVQASNYYYDDDDDDDDGNNNGREEGDDDNYNQQQNDDAYANADDQYGGNQRGDERYYYNRAKIREVEVQVTLHRNWMTISTISGLPILVGFFFMISAWLKRQRNGTVETSVQEAEGNDWYQNWEFGVKPPVLPAGATTSHTPTSKRDFLKSIYVPSSQWHSPTKAQSTHTMPMTEMSTLRTQPAGGTGTTAAAAERGGGKNGTAERPTPKGGEEEYKNSII